MAQTWSWDTQIAVKKIVNLNADGFVHLFIKMLTNIQKSSVIDVSQIANTTVHSVHGLYATWKTWKTNPVSKNRGNLEILIAIEKRIYPGKVLRI